MHAYDIHPHPYTLCGPNNYYFFLRLIVVYVMHPCVSHHWPYFHMRSFNFCALVFHRRI
jgi:hypothetical protein